MWLANFEDGSAVHSKQTFWTKLSKDYENKKLTAVQLSHPHFPKLFISLTNLDKYYFVTEAISFIQGGENSTPSIVAEVIGGFDTDLGVVTEIRLDYRGSVKSRLYPIGDFKYSQDILVDGVKSNKPVNGA